MREIKFRAYSKKLGMSNPFTLLETINSDIGEFEIYMQYTELKDKNGKEIYEGDICKSKIGYIGKIVFAEPSAEFTLSVKREVNKYISENHTLLYAYRELEVIGNIYENPELLEK